MKSKFETALVNTILRDAHLRKHSLSHLKLQKILYFVVGFNCRFKDDWSLEEEKSFEAWPYGPVLRRVFSELVDLTEGVYSKVDTPLKWKGDEKVYTFEEKGYPADLIQQTLDLFSDVNDVDLSDVTHAEGSPWSGVAFRKKEQIPKNKIEDYFKGDEIISEIKKYVIESKVDSFLKYEG